MRIDVHTHFMSLSFVRHLQGRSSLPTTVREGGTYIVQCAEGFNLPMVSKIIDMEEKLHDMEAMGVDMAVLSHGIPGPDVVGGVEADDWAARINDELADIIARFPGKFVGWGCLGFASVERSIAEVDRCIHELGFKGMQVLSNVNNRLLDSPEFRPVLRHIGMQGVPINMHPTVPLNLVGIDKASLMLPLAFLYDSTLATVRLIQSGLFDEVPDLRLIVPHVGAVIPYLVGRIDMYNKTTLQFKDISPLAHSMDHYLRSIYADTVCYHPEALVCCYQVLGADHLLYGTDHPYGAYNVASDLVENLECSASERELIYHGNIERLLKLR